ncbi:sce7726 family protein [Dickeya dadantii]|uniref:sce7726 family protein n=1 Tax=Dickeya dadantii TaxID=204038 RepID=UPI0020A64BFE|nr:sce7726 family protein [Dickeya dadantii]
MQPADNINISLSRFFRRTSFSELAKGGDLKHLISNINVDIFKGKDITFREFFEILFDSLRENYRNEYVYKSAIVNKIVFGRHSPRTSSSAIELPVNNSIVDVAVFNGYSTAYEIKTEYDTPKRLATQAFDYLDVFDKVYIVTHQKLC